MSDILQTTRGSAGDVVEGPGGGAYHLNGLPAKDGGNHIAIARNPEIFGQDQLSISLAFKADTAGVGGKLFNIHTAMLINVTDDGQVVFDLRENGAGESGVIRTTDLNVTDGEWHYLTLAYDARAGAMTGYVDGVAVGEIPVSGPTQVAESWDPMIGYAWGGGFRGLVDEIIISQQVPSAEQVSELHHAFLGTEPAEPGGETGEEPGGETGENPGQNAGNDPGAEPSDEPGEEPGGVVAAPSLLHLTFDDGALADQSESGLRITRGSAGSVVDGAYALNGLHVKQGGNCISVERNEALFSREQMSISLDFKADEAGVGGSLFRIHKAMQIDTTDDGQVIFRLFANSAGESGVINSSGLNVTDGQWHTVTLSYDAQAGAMTGYVDGQAVGEIAISAATKGAESWDPTIGDAWGQGFRGLVDNVAISDQPTSPDQAPEATEQLVADLQSAPEDGSLAASDQPAADDGSVVAGVEPAADEGSVAADVQPAADDGALAPAPAEALLANEPIAETLAAAPRAAAAGHSIIVDNSSELMSALKGASAGDVILLRPGVQYGGSLSNVNPGGEVVITSLDAGRPANISGLQLTNVSNLTFDNLLFEFHGKPTTNQMDVKVSGGSNLQFINSTFKGPADGFATVGTDTPNMMHVSGTRNFTFENNDISGFKHGLALHRSTNVDIKDNDLHHMQGDGMRFSQVKDILIESNKFHDFYGGDQKVTHNDYIQFWTTNTTAPSEDIVIRGNVMMSGKFQSQAIFIRDQLGDAGKGEMRYQNMVIEENVIYNNHHHGITAPATDGLIIRGNTLIIHPVEGRHTTSINVAKSTDVQIYDNVAPRMTIDKASDIVRNDGNILYLDKPGFLDANFVNADAGVGAKLSDLFVDPKGDLMKANGTVMGSELLNPNGSGDQDPGPGPGPVDPGPTDPGPIGSGEVNAIITAEQGDNGRSFIFDASKSTDDDGLVTADEARFVWDFGDGVKAEGLEVNHVYGAAGDYQVMLTVLHEDGVSDTAAYLARIGGGEVVLHNVLDFDDGTLAFRLPDHNDVWV